MSIVAANQPGIPHPAKNDEGYSRGQNAPPDFGLKHRGDGHGGNQKREGLENIGDAHEHHVDPTTEVGGHCSPNDPDQRGNSCDANSRQKSGARPPNDPIVDIVLPLCGAEGMGGTEVAPARDDLPDLLEGVRTCRRFGCRAITELGDAVGLIRVGRGRKPRGKNGDEPKEEKED